jgi:hypothetical protein
MAWGSLWWSPTSALKRSVPLGNVARLILSGRKPYQVSSRGKNFIKVEVLGDGERSAQKINRERGQAE